MRTGIATVSVSGQLTDKLTAIAAAGFDGVEIFDNDLVGSPLSPEEVAGLCADLGLTIDLYQPVRDVEGVPHEGFGAVLRRMRRKLEVAARLGAPTVLTCSNAGSDSVDDPALTAGQLHRLGELAAQHGVTIAFEALAWGRHVNRVQQAWRAVVAADHPAVTLAVDTFHMLARGDGAEALAGVPGERIGFLQVADAPLLDMNVLEWSRHFRCFPGQGTLDVAAVVAAVLDAGYEGPVSLEVFSDLVREERPRETACDARRSLVYLEGQLAARLEPRTAVRARVRAVAPPPERADVAFVEVPPGHGLASLLPALGFVLTRQHRRKPVSWWRNGDAHVLVNEALASRAGAALGLVAPPVHSVAERAAALLWPPVHRTRGAGEALLPGLTSPSGLHLFVSAAPGEPDDWQEDFVAVGAAATEGFTGVDHVGLTVPSARLDQEVGFFRTLFGLQPGPGEEFMEPHGRLRSRALRPPVGDLRLALNAVESHSAGPYGISQIAFACTDLLDRLQLLRSRGLRPMAVPSNYYVDLAARFDLDDDVIELLRVNDVLYDRIGDGELLHAYTPLLDDGCYVELLERRGGYDGYGAANTVVRLAAQERAGHRRDDDVSALPQA
jgi:4-hydroxyphenylpyruvate dioxygenase